MKGLLKLAITLMCVLTVAGCFLLPVNAETEDLNAQLDFTDTYFYDRINERQQWCYNYLKEYYDNIPDECAQYRLDLVHLLPDDSTFSDYADLFFDFSVADSAIKADDPLYRMKGNVTGANFPYYEEGRYFEIYIYHSDIHTADAVQQVNARIEQIVNTVGDGDRYTKLRKMSAYILENTFYDPYLFTVNGEGYDGLGGRGIIYNSSVYGLFLKNISVCDGYSQSVKVLCDALDIPCIIVGNHGHAWNMVQMEDGSWYYLDMTAFSKVRWDDEGFLGFGLDLGLYFQEAFLDNDYKHSFGYDNQYMLGSIHDYLHMGIDYTKEFKITEFPEIAKGKYKYTGDTTDFSYTVAPSTYVPGEPTFSYEVNPDGKTCTVTNFEGRQEGDLVIPETLDGYSVTAIADYAFYYCTGFTGKLVIPDTVETIGKAAFSGCYNLTSIDFSNKLDHIGEGAFTGCIALTDIVLPDMLTTIGSAAFFDCDYLQTVIFGGHVYSIGDKAFDEIYSDLLIKAPNGSEAQEYASENSVSFESYGTNCSFADADGDWEFDNNSHFHTCEHEIKFDFSEHIKADGFNACGDKCDVCDGRSCRGNPVFTDKDFELANKAEANCTSPAYTGDIVCPVCEGIQIFGEYVGSPTGIHISADENLEYDEYMHYQICKDCNQWFDVAEHSGGTATETEYAKCEVCGAEYGELLHVRHEGQGWEYNSDAHWQWCVCGEIMDSGAHSGGTATATEYAKCDVCGAEYGELLKIESEAESTGKTPESSGKPEASSSVPEESDSSVSAGDAPDKTWLIAVIAAAGVVIIVGAILAIKLSRKKK